MDFCFLIAAGIALTALLERFSALQAEAAPVLRPCFFSVEEDEDIRIAGSGHSGKASSDPGDSSANDFFSHHTMGNIQTAMQLGNCLARLFCSRYRQLSSQMSAAVSEQLAILDSYAVNRVIQNLPNSLIAQTVLSTFYNAVGQDDEALYQAVRDPVPFSLYILRDRKNRPDESYGEVFASLCGDPGNRDVAALADEEYRSFYDKCSTMCSGFSFRTID